MSRLWHGFMGWVKRAARVQSESPAPLPMALPWTPGDQAQLATFLASGSGRKLLDRMTAVEFEVLRIAAKDAMHTAHSAGRAAGFGDAKDWLISLSQCSCATEQNSNDTLDGQRDATALSELLAP